MCHAELVWCVMHAVLARDVMLYGPVICHAELVWCVMHAVLVRDVMLNGSVMSC